MKTQNNHLQKRLSNCGIVFLHPYLNPFFEAQGLVRNKKLKNRSCQIKAIQLMLYLATSTSDFTEADELSFFQMLVEFPTNDFIVFQKPLTQKEKNDCNIVLQSLIDQWSALKSISIEGLQEQFIQREAIISDTESSIEINIETSSVDVLLDTIPFNFRNVKLPWLKKLLITVI